MAEAHETFMREALAEARRSLEAGDVPIGAVVVHDKRVVTRAHWRYEHGRLLDHPELLCLLEAERSGRVTHGRERRKATLYTTLEPCALCMSASMSFLLGRLVFALESRTDGAANLSELWQPAEGHPAPGEPPYAIPDIIGGVGRGDSLALIERFLATNSESPFAPWARTLLAA
jgi:tRNA(adenine34) deaminase